MMWDNSVAMCIGPIGYCEWFGSEEDSENQGQEDKSISEELRFDVNIFVVTLCLILLWQERVEKSNEQVGRPLPICDMALREKI